MNTESGECLPLLVNSLLALHCFGIEIIQFVFAGEEILKAELFLETIIKGKWYLP